MVYFDTAFDELHFVDEPQFGLPTDLFQGSVPMGRTDSGDSNATANTSGSWNTSQWSPECESEVSQVTANTSDLWCTLPWSPDGESEVSQTPLMGNGPSYLEDPLTGQVGSASFLLGTPGELLTLTIGNLESASSQASLLADGYFNDYAAGQPPLQCTFITDYEVEQRAGTDYALDAVKTLLSECLRSQFERGGTCQDFVNTILTEAAFQLRVRISGEESYDISYFALASTLSDLEVDYGLRPPSQSSKAKYTQDKKEKFPCQVEGCKSKPFGRVADLDRHRRMRHLGDHEKTKYPCDYRLCARHETPFFRPDHFRDHLRDYHTEDLPRRGLQIDEAWMKTRSRRSVEKGWWRCNKCLVERVSIAEHGYVCPGCGHHCESERQKYREALLHNK